MTTGMTTGEKQLFDHRLQVFAKGSQAQGICYTTQQHRDAVLAFLNAGKEKAA